MFIRNCEQKSFLIIEKNQLGIRKGENAKIRAMRECVSAKIRETPNPTDAFSNYPVLKLVNCHRAYESALMFLLRFLIALRG